MSGLSAIFDVILGLAFIYLLLSLICSAAVEYTEMWFGRRGILLKYGIVELLSICREQPATDNQVGAVLGWFDRIKNRLSGLFSGKLTEQEATEDLDFVDKLYRNPLIYALYSGKLNHGTWFRGGNLPSYIAANTFVLAFIDQLVKEQNIDNRLKVIDEVSGLTSAEKSFIKSEVRKKVSSQTSIPLTEAFRLATGRPLAIPEDLRKTLQSKLAQVPELTVPKTAAELADLIDKSSVIDYGLKGSLSILMAQVEDDYNAAIKTLEDWYSSTTERISGWYRRHTQWVSAIVSTIIVVLLNVDTVSITQSLMVNEELRTAVVEASKASIANGKPENPPESVGAGTNNFDGLTANIKMLKETLLTLGLPIGWHDDGAEKAKHVTTPTIPTDTSQGSSSAGSADRSSRIQQGPDQQENIGDAQGVGNMVVTLLRQIGTHWPEHIGGWIISIVAISFGAPFWFDTLNKLMRFRTALKPQEDEGKGNAGDSKQA